MEDLGQSSANATRSPDKSSTLSTGQAVQSQSIVVDPSADGRPLMLHEGGDGGGGGDGEDDGERHGGRGYEDDEQRYSAAEDEDPIIPWPRNHTPGQLATARSNVPGDQQGGSKATAGLALRQRAISASHPHPLPSTPRPATAPGQRKSASAANSIPDLPPLPREGDAEQKAAAAATDASVAATAASSRVTSAVSARQTSTIISRPVPGKHTAFPPLPKPDDGPDVPPAPASGMYWSKAPVSGSPHSKLRAHTTTMIGSNVYVFGGCDAKTCFNTLYVLDADSFYWSVPHVVGDIPMPLRAMTCTAVGKKLVVFGGGDGPSYYNNVYVLDTVNFRWSKPRIVGDKLPSERRSHTACLYKNGIFVFGGGDGVRALNDIWRLDVSDMSKMSWRLISSAEKPLPGSRERQPKARGYHTANMVGSKLIIYGGSDGSECFDDVWIYDVEWHVWKLASIPITFRRLSHTATVVGSYLFVIGGHDGHEYCNDVLLLNLVTMTWDKRKTYGLPPSGRGYHSTVLHDSRLLVVGGFDGSDVFSDVVILELAVHAYYSQISHFTINV
ncbi:hypothetical protein Trco_002699 [Trichoderma cornu-damae]|uniref:Galactose oxidase n=1 Tax=Trichoderma cornu-damae TaxID=654480 RepID=A0A9P8TY93_9HYPO|nr:hypothetical protein Trco_002699 [Trichoderma cornu-damae]